MSNSLLSKEQRLIQQISQLDSLAIAYSGGVDSRYLADVAHETLGDKVCMVIADSPSIPRSELQAAIDLAKSRKWKIEVIKTAEHLNKEYQANSGDRCFFCKTELFQEMTEWCAENNISTIAYGAIIDDLGDHRPGAKAAENFHITAPLQGADLSKKEIRFLSEKRQLPTASKASFACLASRLPVGEKVSVKKLSQIEMAEEIIKELGVVQYRARHHGDICRIEIDMVDIQLFTDTEKRERLVKEIKKLGYKFVALDLTGYKTGSTAH
ncbi:MAG: ATP-dependent sacrificial sulfur transferase LarE [Lentisphaeraceae bacterium]|nr:ATP-dependent sacrificial sulfur transferase LarE [Lentisphaeraceae bacterium]